MVDKFKSEFNIGKKTGKQDFRTCLPVTILLVNSSTRQLNYTMP